MCINDEAFINNLNTGFFAYDCITFLFFRSFSNSFFKTYPQMGYSRQLK